MTIKIIFKMDYFLSMIGNCSPTCLFGPLDIKTSFETIEGFNCFVININSVYGYNINWKDVKILAQKNIVFIKYYDFEKQITLPETYNYNNATASYDNNCILVKIPSYTPSKIVLISGI